MTSKDNVEENLNTALDFINQAAQRNTLVVAFPENFLFMGPESKYLDVAQDIDGEFVRTFQEQAKKFKIAVLMGSFLERNPLDHKKCFNTSVLIDKNGEILASYRKIHLFDVQLPSVQLLESKTISPGNQVAICDSDFGRVGLSVCYDLRFPLLYQNLTRKGAQIIFVPSAFTMQTGKFHWIALLKARAIENQVYIAAPAQYGAHNSKRTSFGSTVLIDPWGDIRLIAEEGEGVFFGEIDLEYLNKVRTNMPVLSHRVEGMDY